MKAKKRIVLLAVLAVLIPALWAAVRAADKPGGSVPQLTVALDDRDTLRGLQGVHVVVKNLRPEVERLGLTRDALQTDTELQLRQYGIKVFSGQESATARNASGLWVDVAVLGANNDTSSLLAVTVNVRCQQAVYLARDPTILCVGATWHTGTVATVSRTKLADVRDMVKDDVAKFINDYLAANPKNGKVKEESKTKEEAAESKP